jgi:uncharacterized membrane protein
MITSFKFVQDNLVVMIVWAALLAGLTFVAMIPGFFGIFIVLPVLGHASCHLYAQVKAAGAA